MTALFGLQRCPYRIATSQELMQPECENRETTRLGAAQVRPLKQPVSEHLGASFRIDARHLCELVGSALSIFGESPFSRRPALQPPGRLSDELAGLRLLADAECRFDPGCERMTPKRFVAGGRRGTGSHCAVDFGHHRFDREVDLRGRAFQCFTDDLLGRKIHSEQGLGHPRHFAPLVFGAPVAGHGG